MNSNTTKYTVLSMGMVILLITAIFIIILTVILVKIKTKAYRGSREAREKEDDVTQIYEDITRLSTDLSQFEKNPSYEICPPRTQLHTEQ